MTYTQVRVLYGLNQMLIPSGERMCRLDSEAGNGQIEGPDPITGRSGLQNPLQGLPQGVHLSQSP